MKRKIYVIIDESGGKGYFDNPEAYKNEVGVLIGYVINENEYSLVFDKLTRIADKFKKAHQKTHLMSMTEREKKRLCAKYNRVFRLYKTNCFFEAIYVQGYHEFNLNQQEIARRSTSTLHELGILVNNHEQRPLLYSELFNAVVLKTILFYYCKYYTTDLHFEIIVDNIDKGTLKKLQDNLKNDINLIINRKQPVKLCSYKKELKKTTVDAECIFNTGITYPENMRFENISYNISSTDNSLTLGADIISYNLRKYLEKKSKKGPMENLNTKKAIKGFPMKYLFVNTLLSENNFGDKIYRHPKCTQ